MVCYPRPGQVVPGCAATVDSFVLAASRDSYAYTLNNVLTSYTNTQCGYTGEHWATSPSYGVGPDLVDARFMFTRNRG